MGLSYIGGILHKVNFVVVCDFSLDVFRKFSYVVTFKFPPKPVEALPADSHGSCISFNAHHILYDVITDRV